MNWTWTGKLFVCTDWRIGVKNISSKMVPRNLTEYQEDAWMSVLLICWNKWKPTQSLWAELSLVMKVVFFNMIRRPNIKVWNGIQSDHQGQRKHTYPSQKWNACILLWFHGHCSQRVRSCWTDSQSILLHRNSWKTEKEGHAGSSKHHKKLDPSSKQCANPHSTLSSTVFDVKMRYSNATAFYWSDLTPCN